MAHKLTAIFILILFAGAVAWFVSTAQEKTESPKAEAGGMAESDMIQPLEAPRITIIDPIRGNPASPITIIEFGDYICGFCKQVEPAIRKILETYPEQVLFVWKDLPIDDLHTYASRSAIAARCAGEQGKYWEFHDRLLAQGEGVLIPPLSAIAAELSLDEANFSECLESVKPRAQIEKTLEEAAALGVTGAPFFYINGMPFGGRTFEEFDTVIKTLVNQPK